MDSSTKEHMDISGPKEVIKYAKQLPGMFDHHEGIKCFDLGYTACYGRIIQRVDPDLDPIFAKAEGLEKEIQTLNKQLHCNYQHRGVLGEEIDYCSKCGFLGRKDG